MEKIRDWINSNGSLVGKMLSVVILVFGILVIIGAILNWDWLYKADEHYQNKWTLGQLSRYLGRNTARILGFVGGVIVVIAGATWSYMAFFKN